MWCVLIPWYFRHFWRNPEETGGCCVWSAAVPPLSPPQRQHLHTAVTLITQNKTHEHRRRGDWKFQNPDEAAKLENYRRESEKEAIHKCGVNPVISLWAFAELPWAGIDLKLNSRSEVGDRLHIFRLLPAVSDSLSTRVTILWQFGIKTD